MRIAEAAFAWGAEVSLTNPHHASGTDRIAEVAAKLRGVSHVINIQGDEPLVDPKLINQLARKMQRDPKIEMITAVHPFENPADAQSPHQVKAVLDRQNHALYFSRCPIPFARDAASPVAILPPPGHLRLSPRTALALRPLEALAAGEGGSARAIARAGEWRKHSRGRHRKRLARGGYAGRCPGDRAPAARPVTATTPGSFPMKYIFVTGGVVSSLGKGLAAASLGTLLELRGLARPPAKVRSLSERRSRDDEPVSTRRSLRPQRRRRDRPRSRPLRALHQLRPLAEQQPDQRTGLRERHSERAARRLSRQYRAGHSARHRRNQGPHPPGGRS